MCEAKELVRLLKGPSGPRSTPFRFNPWPGTGYECSD
jgi:hypothetical protein